jgi:hypothetical protein
LENSPSSTGVVLFEVNSLPDSLELAVDSVRLGSVDVALNGGNGVQVVGRSSGSLRLYVGHIDDVIVPDECRLQIVVHCVASVISNGDSLILSPLGVGRVQPDDRPVGESDSVERSSVRHASDPNFVIHQSRVDLIDQHWELLNGVDSVSRIFDIGSIEHKQGSSVRSLAGSSSADHVIPNANQFLDTGDPESVQLKEPDGMMVHVDRGDDPTSGWVRVVHKDVLFGGAAILEIFAEVVFDFHIISQSASRRVVVESSRNWVKGSGVD